ncbi:VOC family protein [Picosynechococcus sp. PCC 7003]|uniref:VOC family protein n=1 Tax=Picosynechococcus sp. PCC 7003 TaxID=374981 RepID=UPI0009FDB468|nr:VOC family protein [Picosynechococcus sp. PCC 7003]
MANFSELFVAIAADPWQEVVDFYRGLLDDEPLSYSQNRYAEFQIKGLKLGIFKPSPQHQAEFVGNAGALSFCLEVDDLAQAIATVRALGGTMNGEISTASHGRECYAYDPAKNRLILHQSNKTKPNP